MRAGSRAGGDGTGEAGLGVSVVQDAGGGEDLPREARGSDDVVVSGGLIERHQHRQGLADVDVQRIVEILKRVSSLDLDELQLVILDSEVDRRHEPHVGDPKEAGRP